VIEIRFHGMGGQGAVMGALILAEAAFSEGRYAQKIPVYGGMRRGGDVTVFLRLDDKPVRRTSGVYEPDALVVLDPALTAHERVRRGLKEGGMAILNDERSPGEVDLGVELSKVATVDATGISTEVLGQRAIPITNTATLRPHQAHVPRPHRRDERRRLQEGIRRGKGEGGLVDEPDRQGVQARRGLWGVHQVRPLSDLLPRGHRDVEGR
jgi:pyruvate ferredoxin oxidoreductase gamma subunit/2-oxoisovalerate ferredoxin oxidoreductase gamma subunit